MLSRDELVALFQELEEKDVLSVYVDAREEDPALRDAWRVRLDREISSLRRRMDEEAPGAVAAFSAAWGHVEARLRADGGVTPPRRGWVAFATADGLRYGGPVPASMPDLVRWQKGVHAAPYIRALKQERPVTVVLLDGRRARVFEQAGGSLVEHDGVLADTFLGDLTDTGMRKGSARASGVRGETSTDQAQRLLDVAAERMRKTLVERVVERAGSDGLVVLGGPAESVKKLSALLPRALEGRVTLRSSLHLDMTAAEILAEVRDAAGDLSEGGHEALARQVLDAARASGRGALGPDATLKALREHRVDVLLLSRSFLHAHPGVADRAVGLAFSQGADVEEVSGEAGELLDREAQGLAARLRYRGAEGVPAA